MESIWKSDVELIKRKSLQSDRKVQNLVIGGGMAGILIAYFLRKKGQEVLVVEAKRIGSGQTENTTAKITSQHGLCYEKILRKIGREAATEYAAANEEAINSFEQIIREEQIDCNFERKPAYLYTGLQESVDKLRKEAEIAESLGIKSAFVAGKDITELPFKVEGAVCFEKQAQFHPLKFIGHLAEKMEVCENTKVLSVKKHMVCTDRGCIEAENIIFATHYPIVNIPGFYFLRQHQERSYVLALKRTEKKNVPRELSGMYYGIDKGALSFRSFEDILLLGGGGHRTGKRGGKYSCLKKAAEKYYPGAEKLAFWSAQDCMSHAGIPFIGKYSVVRPYWYVATGFHKWGMTSSMVAAEIISGLICGGEEVYKGIFSPQRFYVRAAFANLVKDVGESVWGLIGGSFSSGRRRCTHLGCRIKWNDEESTWECPCHGSRYDKKGKLIDNPSKRDLKE